MRFVHISIFLLLSLTLSQAKLSVRYPPDLRSAFDKVNGIDYVSLVPADKIDLDKISIGTLILADPVTACSDIKLPETFQNSEKLVHKPIIIARRGECSFAQKAHVAELAGAQMLIIVSNSAKVDLEAKHRKITQAHIEVIEISKLDGDKLITYLEKPEKERENVEMFFKLEPENSGVDIIKTNSSKVEIQFWYSSSDSTGGTYDFIGNLRDISLKLGKLIDIEFHYVLYRCHTCTKAGFKDADENCVSGGRYCDPEPAQLESKHKGNKVIIEDLRQACMLKKSALENFWNFASYYGGQCISKNDEDLEECVQSAYQAIGIPKDDTTALERCMAESFSPLPSGPLEKTLSDNTILKSEMDLQRKIGVSHYPALYVNGNRYEGNLKNQRNVFDFICKHYIDIPYACRSSTLTTTNTSYSFGFSVVVILGTVTVMVLMIYCVRRMVRRKIMGEMKDEISNTIAQYTKFRDRGEA